ncbi:MAG: hypothetical protein MRERV_17c014 [Mycoplasmataceae bacterium RV_VA103A]|nr:MAG: hypothetical protein MRERV_22c044 [Mycoplasmataceae bacterium RV_VA103A]KLL04578.1 MAG: hypothetical protein MRERV_17c014 [Mycoplasmataceae bacterium RV_VA103A]
MLNKEKLNSYDKDKELQNKIKKLAREHLGQTIISPQDILEKKWNKKTSDIIGNLDRPEYLADKYGITKNHIQECYQVMKDGLADNPNVRANITELVTMVRKYLEEGIGCKITKEEMTPVAKVLAELIISLLVQKNMWWARQDYEKEKIIIYYFTNNLCQC